MASQSLRALAALALGVAFFAASFLLVAGLVWLGVNLAGEVGHWRGSSMFIGMLFVVALMLAAGVVGWALLPRRVRFVAPGPELKRELHPALFKELDRVAARTGERAPQHVYLEPRVNAFVADVGGVLGLGTTRVMGLGLPLLHCLTIAELRGVLAHEFGHFSKGHTTLGPWVHRVRASVSRVVENLTDAAALSWAGDLQALALFFHALRAPFVAFGHFYLRFTLALSRAQELAADALAVQLEGPEVVVSGLQRSRAAAVGFEGFLESEVAPLLSEGYLPPIGPGLARFLSAAEVTKQLERVAAAIDLEPTHALDSHPPLKERVAHARSLRTTHRGTPAREGMAFELLTHHSELELLLAQPWVKGRDLKRVRWEDAGPLLHRVFRARAAELAPTLAGRTPASLPRERHALLQQLEPHFGPRLRELSDERLLLFAAGVWRAPVIAPLLDAGFTLEAEPGRPFVVTRGDERFEPVTALHAWLFDGDDAAWNALWSSCGLANATFQPEAAALSDTTA